MWIQISSIKLILDLKIRTGGAELKLKSFEPMLNNEILQRFSIRSLRLSFWLIVELKLRDNKLDRLKGSQAQMPKWCVHATIREEKSFPISRLSRRIHPSWACLYVYVCACVCVCVRMPLCVCVCVCVCVSWIRDGEKRVAFLMNWRFLKGSRQQWKEDCMAAANIKKRRERERERESEGCG